jgi:2-succinyl-6-hydroxy-2,4-cyclohexadiene-1-carboxylate synthase
MEDFLREWYTLPIYDSINTQPELIDKIIAKKKSGDAIALADAITRLSPGVQPSLWNKLPQVNQPVTIIAGERDKKYCDIARRMAAIMPTADLRIVPGAGHIVHYENRDEFVTALKFFLSAYIL